MCDDPEPIRRVLEQLRPLLIYDDRIRLLVEQMPVFSRRATIAELDRLIQEKFVDVPLDVTATIRDVRNRLVHMYDAADPKNAHTALGPRPGDRPRIVRPPGMILDRIAEFLFSRRTYEEVFVQLIADLREEHAAALAQGRVWKARWVRLRGTWAFGQATLKKAPFIEKFLRWAFGLVMRAAK